MNKNAFSPLLLMLAIGFVLGHHCASPERPDLESLSAPLVPALRGAASSAGTSVDAMDLLEWARADDPIVVVRNRTDALPNGLALSAVPFLVHWEASEDGAPFVVRNVNVACDPLRGTTTLATVRVPRGGLESAEFVLVRDRVYGESKRIGHGMLRFVFGADTRAEIVVAEGETWHGDPYVDDLVISYEAWREPGVVYDAVEGLRPNAYALTSRCYSGAAYYLQTALKQYEWECYPLAMSEGHQGEEELLRVCLMLGDGLARRVLAELVRDGELEVPDASAFEGWSAADEERAIALFRQDQVPDDPVQGIVGDADISYHTLERSCMSLAMATIDLAERRVTERTGGRAHVPLAVAPTDLPEWISNLPSAGRGEMLATLPGAILWLAGHQNVVPANAWRILRDGGLLRVEDGEVVKHVYVPEGVTPWGRVAENL